MNYSRQRDMIERIVKYSKSHLTAKEIHKKVEEDIPNISLGTVYRNLDSLVKKGNVLKINLADGKDRFDGNTKYHYHAICSNCGKVVDVFMNYMTYLDDAVRSETNINVISHTLVFNTICPECEKSI